MVMPRWLTLLLIMTIALANGTAASAALCRHGSAHEHAAALMSSNASMVSEAAAEDSAAAAVKAATLADAATLALGVYIAPEPLEPPFLSAAKAPAARPENSVMRAGRGPPPLLQPPAI